MIIQRDIEKDAFYREALFHDDTKAVESEHARRLGEVLFAFIEQAALPYQRKTMPFFGGRLLFNLSHST